MTTDPEWLDCPACKADDFEFCDHTEDERVELRTERAAKNRAKRKRNAANRLAQRREALRSGDVWV
jgi:hypothetical protein